MFYLNYSITDPQERVKEVENFISKTPEEELTPYLLEYLSNYLLFISDKTQTKKERNTKYSITTKNREITINKRQTSYEGMIDALENGEDGLHSLINNDKNQLLDRKEKITKEELETFPQLKKQYETIQSLTEMANKSKGSRKYSIKKQIVEQWQQLYLIRASLKGTPSTTAKPINLNDRCAEIPETITMRPDGSLIIDSQLSLLEPDHVSYLLCNYSQLKQDTYGHLSNDVRWMLIELEDLVTKLFPQDSPYYNLILWKTDGVSNREIQERMRLDGIEHSEQYYSSIWRQRIPKLIAEQARKDWVLWYYSTHRPTEWKKCSKCGKSKPMHPYFFGKNTTKDGYYSACKCCRNQVAKEE